VKTDGLQAQAGVEVTLVENAAVVPDEADEAGVVGEAWVPDQRAVPEYPDRRHGRHASSVLPLLPASPFPPVEPRMVCLLRTATGKGGRPARRGVAAACASSSRQPEGRQANHAEIERKTTTC